MSQQFRAPWGTLLRGISLAATAFLGGIAVLEAFVIPRDLLGGWPWYAATFTPLLVLAGGGLFTVRGYTLEPDTLSVRRLLWSTRVPLAGLQAAWAAPDAMQGSFRLFGNGGLYSFSGLYRSKQLGNYRAFVTDWKRSVVLDLPRRKVVLSPESPGAFLAAVAAAYPAARVEPATPGDPQPALRPAPAQQL